MGARDCVFLSINKDDGSIAIKASTCSDDVFVSNCKFANFGNSQDGHDANAVLPCVLIKDQADAVRPVTVELECVGNTFENNYDYPIGIDLLDNFSAFDGSIDCKLRMDGNELKGFNGSNSVKDGNCAWIRNTETNGEYQQYAKCKRCGSRGLGVTSEDNQEFICTKCVSNN